MNSQPSDSYMPRPVVLRTTYNSTRTRRIPSVSTTRTPSFPPASISEVTNMSTTHQPTPDPSANLPQLSANPSTGPSTAPSAIPPTGNPQPINATMMANAINDLVKSNLPSRVKISDAGVRCSAVQRPFLLNHAPNRGAGSVHAPNRAPHRPAPVQSGAEGFSARCTRFEQGPIGQKKAFLNVATDLQVHPDQTYFVTSSEDKMGYVDP